MNKVHEFFRLIYSCADPEWFLEIRRLEPLPVTWHIDRVKNLESWVNEGLKMALSAQSLHFRVVPARTENRKDLAMATTLWADVERYVSEEEWEALRDLGIPPGAVVHSGRGMHIYWSLKSPTDRDRAGEKRSAGETSVRRRRSGTSFAYPEISGELQLQIRAQKIRGRGNYRTYIGHIGL